MNILQGKKLNDDAASWGWFCVWLKDTDNCFEIHDGKDSAWIQKFKQDKEGAILTDYVSGQDLLKYLHVWFIQYCIQNSFCLERDISFADLVEAYWKDMLSVATVEDTGLKIKKY